MVKLTEADWEKMRALNKLTKKEQHDALDYIALHSSTKSVRTGVFRTRAQVKKSMSKNAMAFVRKWYPGIRKKAKLSG